jgi:hypothetical protein
MNDQGGNAVCRSSFRQGLGKMRNNKETNMFNPDHLVAITRMRREELLREAQQDRALRDALDERRSPLTQLRANLEQFWSLMKDWGD